MKSILILLLAAPSAWAVSDAEIVSACLAKGKEKIALQASAYGCAADLSHVTAIEVDNRWYNPSKYVWYHLPGECNGFEGITKMVQFYRGSCK